MKYRFIGKVERDCPLCGERHKVELRSRDEVMPIKGEDTVFEYRYYFCPDATDAETDEFVSGKLMSENNLRARDAYRVEHGLLTSDEIIRIRKAYGLTQAEMSKVLGWGDVTISRYETKTIQDETYDQVLRQVRDDPYYLLEKVRTHRGLFEVDRYESLNTEIQSKIEQYGAWNQRKEVIANYYARFDVECDANGYSLLRLDVVGKIAAFFAHYCKNLHKVKLMKLLWYTDAFAFKLTKHSLTGLVYQHMPYGALPICHEELMFLPEINVRISETENGSSYLITPKDDIVDIGMFDEVEEDILYSVLDKFKYMATTPIVKYMHEEDAYMNTMDGQIIPFSLCDTLRDF